MPSPIDSAAVTLNDYAKISQSPLERTMIEAVYNTPNVVKDIPLKSNPRFKVTRPRLEDDGLPTVSWGSVNKAPTSTKTTTEQHEEVASIVRSRIRVDDRILNQPDAVIDKMKVQTMGFARAWAYAASDAFFNNDPSGANGGDPLAWAGLRYRLDNPLTFKLASEMKIDSGALAFDGAITSTIANEALEFIMQALDYMEAEDGNGVVVYGNDIVLRKWATAIRVAGEGAGFGTTTDAYDRRVRTYANAKIRNTGRKANQTDRIIGFEDADGTPNAAGLYTSLYFVKFGEGNFTGWHDGSIEPKYRGMLDDGVTHQWVVDYLIGLESQHNRCIARLHGIKVR
jgi:hypothetical protein